MTPQLWKGGVIQRLVEVAKSEYRSALEILFINHRNIPRLSVFPGKDAFGLIELNGPIKEELEEVNKLITLAKSTFSMRIGPIFSEYFAPLIDLAEQLKLLTDELKPEIIPDIVNSLRKYPAEQPVSLFKKDTVEYYTAILLESLIIQWRKQPDALRDTQTIKSLQQIKDLMTPQLQVGMCAKCGNFELLMGSHPLRRKLNCPKCSHLQICARVYLFNEQFSELKKDDKDLAYFIYNYMQSLGVQAELFKMFPPDVELDVYLKDSNTDIECTILLREKLAIDKGDAKSIAGDLSKTKIEKRLDLFHKIGIKRVIFFTNLLKDDSERLEKEIQERLKAKNIRFEIRVVPRTLEDFFNALDEEVKIALKGRP